MANEKIIQELLNKVESLESEVKKLNANKGQPELLVYGTKELATAMGMSLNYAGILMAQKSFPSIKIGGAWKVSKKALEEWLEHNRWHAIDLGR